MGNVIPFQPFREDEELPEFCEFVHASPLAKTKRALYGEVDLSAESFVGHKCYLSVWAPNIELLRGKLPDDVFLVAKYQAETAFIMDNMCCELRDYVNHSARELRSAASGGKRARRKLPPSSPLARERVAATNKCRDYIGCCWRELASHMVHYTPDVDFSSVMSRSELTDYWQAIIARPGANLRHYINDQCVFMNFYQQFVEHRLQPGEYAYMEAYKKSERDSSSISTDAVAGALRSAHAWCT